MKSAKTWAGVWDGSQDYGVSIEAFMQMVQLDVLSSVAQLCHEQAYGPDCANEIAALIRYIQTGARS